jgi:hypothetical protein
MVVSLKSIFIYLVVFVSLTRCEAENISPIKSSTKVISQDTLSRINVPGTHIFFTISGEFSIAQNFVGLINSRNGATIQIFDQNGINYFLDQAKFTPEKFNAQGMKVYEFNDTTINRYRAKYISMIEDQKAKGFAVIFGDSTFSSMIISHYPANDVKTEQEVKTALYNLVYDRAIKTDPLIAEKYSLVDSKSIFKYARSTSGLNIYSINGVKKNNYNDEPVITTSSIPYEGKDNEGVANMMMDMLEGGGFLEKKVMNKSTVQINGQPAFEMEMTGKLNNEKLTFYYLVTKIDSTNALFLQARYKENARKILPEVKKLSHTIMIK